MCVQEPCVYLLSAASVVIRNTNDDEKDLQIIWKDLALLVEYNSFSINKVFGFFEVHSGLITRVGSANSTAWDSPCGPIQERSYILCVRSLQYLVLS